MEVFKAAVFTQKVKITCQQPSHLRYKGRKEGRREERKGERERKQKRVWERERKEGKKEERERKGKKRAHPLPWGMSQWSSGQDRGGSLRPRGTEMTQGEVRCPREHGVWQGRSRTVPSCLTTLPPQTPTARSSALGALPTPELWSSLPQVCGIPWKGWQSALLEAGFPLQEPPTSC